MKLKIIFLCVLSLITLVLSQFEFAYSVDLGTDYVSGVMDTNGANFSSGSIEATKSMILMIGGLVLFVGYIYILLKLGNNKSTDKKKYSEEESEDNTGCGCHFTLIELIIVIVVILVLAASAQPGCVLKSRWPARQKACYSNIRVLQSAVELYNMDVPGKNMMKSLNIEKLIRQGYLKEKPSCPENSSNEYVSLNNLSDNGMISCGKDPIGATPENQGRDGHGTINGKAFYFNE